MKTIQITLRNAILVAALLVTTLAQGFEAPQPNVLIKVGQSQKLIVSIQEVQDDTELHLIGANQETIYMESVNEHQRTYSKSFDLTNLDGGSYTLVVRIGNREIRQPFALREQQVALDSKKRYEVFLPQVKVTEQTVELNLLNRQVATVRVAILNVEGELVYEDTIPNVINVERRYNLEHLQRGAYTLVVRTPERVFYQDFTRKN